MTYEIEVADTGGATKFIEVPEQRAQPIIDRFVALSYEYPPQDEWVVGLYRREGDKVIFQMDNHFCWKGDGEHSLVFVTETLRQTIP